MASLGTNRLQLSASFLWRLLGIVALVVLITFFVRLYRVRTRFRRAIKEHGIPTLPHSFLFGNMIPVGKALASHPSDISKLSLSYLLMKAYPELMSEGVIYFDSWPFGKPMLAVFHPDLMAQFTQDKSLPKDIMVSHELGPMTDLKDLVTMEGQEWKTWRSVFNPGFSAKNLTALLPAFLEEIQVLKERLVGAAKSGEVIVMEETVQKATVDVICRAALGIRLHSQTRGALLLKLMQDQIWWLVCDQSLTNTIKEWVPWRQFCLWNNNRRMRNILIPTIEEAWGKIDHSSSSSSSEPKTINTLAIQAYKAEVQQQQTASKSPKIDPRMLDILIAQLKIFIFAGHDTTASTLSFAYSRLYRAPEILAKVRAEHDTVLGPDPAAALARLTETPSLLNQLPYTSAVIKEILRLYPPAATVRAGHPDFVLTHPDTGRTYPTAGFAVWATSWLSHRHPDYWPRAEEFLPERWLAREGEELHVRKNAWRPFELGPRNCIGQELAQVELRAILAMTLRELEVEPAYAKGSPEGLGEQAYQTMGVGDITGHIKDGYPARIRLRNLKSG